MKILLTSTSFSDTPGKHQRLLKKQNFKVDMLRGPLKEKDLLPIISKYDGVICGDDEYTARVLETGKKGKLKYISKYGVGLDKINLKAAKKLGIIVTNCPAVNKISVAEHTFALLLSYVKNVHLEYNYTFKGEWHRMTGYEISGKTIGIAGLGAVGKEVAKRAKSFGMNVIAFDTRIDNNFIKKHKIKTAATFSALVKHCDILSLHLPLTNETEKIIEASIIKNHLKKGVIIINTARGGLVDTNALIDGLEKNIIRAYLTDVLENEPMRKTDPLLKHKNVIITPHVASRTYENVERQGICAINNLINFFQSIK